MSIGHDRRHRLRQLAERFVRHIPHLDEKERQEQVESLHSVLRGVDSYARHDEIQTYRRYQGVDESG